MSSTSDNAIEGKTSLKGLENSDQVLDTGGETKIKADESASEKEKEVIANSESGSRPTSSQSVSKEDSREDDEPSRGPASEKKDESPERRRPKSSCSGEVIFTAKRKQKSRIPLAPGAHNVTFTVTIALAIPSGKVRFCITRTPKEAAILGIISFEYFKNILHMRRHPALWDGGKVGWGGSKPGSAQGKPTTISRLLGEFCRRKPARAYSD